MQVDDGGLARRPPRRERLTTALTATVSASREELPSAERQPPHMPGALPGPGARARVGPVELTGPARRCPRRRPPRYLRWVWKKPTSVCQVSVVLSVVLVGLQWSDFTRVEDG